MIEELFCVQYGGFSCWIWKYFLTVPIWQIFALENGNARTMWEQLGGRISILGFESYGQMDWSMYVFFFSYTSFFKKKILFLICITFLGLRMPKFWSTGQCQFFGWQLGARLWFISLHGQIIDIVLLSLQFWRCYCWFSWSKGSNFKVG